MYLIPWVRWRGSGWISEFVWRHRRRFEIWESWNWEFWQFGNLETWTSGTWKSENLGSKQIQQWKSSKYVLPTMLARSGLVGKFLRPFFMPYQAISHGPTKTKKTCRNFDYLLWWAHRPYSPGLGCCCYPPLAGMYVDDPPVAGMHVDSGEATDAKPETEFDRSYYCPPQGGRVHEWVHTAPHRRTAARAANGVLLYCYIIVQWLVGALLHGGSAIWNLLSSHRVIDSDRTKNSHPIFISPKIVQWFTMGQSEVQSEGFWCYYNEDLGNSLGEAAWKGKMKLIMVPRCTFRCALPKMSARPKSHRAHSGYIAILAIH